MNDSGILAMLGLGLVAWCLMTAGVTSAIDVWEVSPLRRRRAWARVRTQWAQDAARQRQKHARALAREGAKRGF